LAWFFTEVAGNSFIVVNSSLELSAAGCAMANDETMTRTIKNNFRIKNI
jgi:hypothetical protein